MMNEKRTATSIIRRKNGSSSLRNRYARIQHTMQMTPKVISITMLIARHGSESKVSICKYRNAYEGYQFDNGATPDNEGLSFFFCLNSRELSPRAVKRAFA